MFYFGAKHMIFRDLNWECNIIHKKSLLQKTMKKIQYKQNSYEKIMNDQSCLFFFSYFSLINLFMISRQPSLEYSMSTKSSYYKEYNEKQNLSSIKICIKIRKKKPSSNCENLYFCKWLLYFGHFLFFF